MGYIVYSRIRLMPGELKIRSFDDSLIPVQPIRSFDDSLIPGNLYRVLSIHNLYSATGTTHNNRLPTLFVCIPLRVGGCYSADVHRHWQPRRQPHDPHDGLASSSHLAFVRARLVFTLDNL